MALRRRTVVFAVALAALAAGVGLAALVSGDDGEPSPTAVTTTEAPADEQAIEQAVADAAAAVERGDPPAGIEPGELPGTDELSIESVRVEGDRASATLSSGAVVELRRAGGRWRVTGVRAP